MGEQFWSLATQIPVVVATFGFCGWLIKLIFDRLLEVAVTRILEAFKLTADGQTRQMDRMLDLLQEHARGHRL